MTRRIIVAVIGAALVVAPTWLAAAEASAAPGAAARGASVNWPVVRPGARGERVRVIQLLLNDHGAHVVVDSKFGASTTTAVKAFQRKRGLLVDGFVGQATWVKLIVTIGRRARGDAVLALQHQLRYQYGYRTLPVDGVFGAGTVTAVTDFQRKHQLNADGIAGSATWKALEA